MSKPMPEYDFSLATITEEIALVIYGEGAWCGDCEYSAWGDCDLCQLTCRTIALAVLESPTIKKMRTRP